MYSLDRDLSQSNPAMLVTIYIPTQNRRELLQRAIRSVLTQNYTDIELIVVDDCSHDDTFEFLTALAASDPRVSALRNASPEGAPKARNRAILNASGEFVTGLDDDDYFAAGRIRSFVDGWNALSGRKIKPSALYSPTVRFGPRQSTVTARPSTLEFQDLFIQNSLGNQIFAPREHYLGAGLFDETLPAWQDLDLFIRVLRRYGTAYRVDEPTYYYDEGEGRARISTQSARIRLAMEMIRAKYQDADEMFGVALCLQMFNGYYAMRPRWDDFRYILGKKPSVENIALLAMRCLLPGGL
jgi:glycosyltransferase involved in cell wall biosynthesis